MSEIIANMTPVTLAVGVPFSGRPVVPEWAISFAAQAYPINLTISRITVKGMPIAEAREHILTDAYKRKARFLFFWDDDVQPPIDAVRRLIYQLEQHKGRGFAAITGVYCAKQEPMEPIIYKEAGGGAFWHWKIGDVFEIAEAGAGCLLIDLEQLRDIPRPWFIWTDDGVEQKAGHTRLGSTSEDLNFFRLIKRHGFRALCDSSVLCNHWDWKTGKVYGLPDDSFPVRDERIARALTIPGWMAHQELVQLADWASKHERIVEVGSYQGRSTRALADNCYGRVFAFDDYKGPRDAGQGNEHTAVSKAFQQHMADYLKSGHVVMVDWPHEDPEHVLALMREEYKDEVVLPDMVFIDGSHEYADVKRDVEFWKTHLAPGGLLCGHDSNWTGVDKVLTELSAEAVVELASGSLWFVKQWQKDLTPDQQGQQHTHEVEAVGV